MLQFHLKFSICHKQISDCKQTPNQLTRTNFKTEKRQIYRKLMGKRAGWGMVVCYGWRCHVSQKTFKAKRSDDSNREERVNRLRKENASMCTVHLTLSSSECSLMFGAFVILILIQSSQMALQDSRKTHLPPLRVTYPEPAHQSPDPGASGSAVWELYVNTNTDET